ncbi:MAG TPA: hypothetical protein VGI22_24365 [Xanthobacteraceae bacterium]
MIRISPLAVALSGCLLLCGPAFPQGSQPDSAQAPSAPAPSAPAPSAPAPGASPENEDSRFTFFHVDGGYLRLDGRSGRVSMCTRREAGWLCQALPEERAAFEAEIARLQDDNAALKRVVLAHDLPLPAGVRPDAPPTGAGPRVPAAADREAYQIMSVIEDVWRRLVALIVSVQKDLLERS